MTSTATIAARSAESTTPPHPALELRGLTKRFGSVTAVDSLDLAVAEGESIALLGPSGSGKSTMLGLIAGFHPPTAGDILLRGHDISRLPPAERNIGVVFQHYALFPHMSVLDNVAYGLKMRGWKRRPRLDRAADMLEIVGLGGYGARSPRQLSGGQQQRVALARALAFEPSILLLDEPLGALDREIRFQMQAEIRRVHRELGTTMIHVTHDKEEALALGDRIAVMQHGRLVAAATPQELFARPGTPFVAGFFCGYNLLPAEPVRPSDGASPLRVADVTVDLGRWGDDSGQSEYLIAIPPTSLRVGAADPSGYLVLDVEVSDVLFLGDLTEVSARSGDVALLARTSSTSVSTLEIGGRAQLHARLDSLIVIPC